MCGIAGVIYKDKKSHPVGKALTSMLESLQHRGPDSAGYAIYGSLNYPENYYQLNIEVQRRKGTLENLKSLLQVKIVVWKSVPLCVVCRIMP